MDSSKTSQIISRECAICGFTTSDNIVVCPEDGSALVTHKPDPFIGTTIAGRFRIELLIGSGGMGNVYKATQEVVERPVAVKVLHSEKLQQRDAVLRFQREARAAATLSHPNIVGFFDYGLTEDNIPFIVMDYIEGVSLFDSLKQSNLSIHRFISIFSQVSDALQHAHDKGIIHRDIKPSNIMLVKKEDGSELVKILDFGIAKLLPSKDSQAGMTLTQTGELFGSPQYMSPEQFAGQTLDARSDMYSMGCVMYESLTGNAPAQAESIIGLIEKHTHETPPSFRTVPGLQLPAQLEAVVFTTLEKDPEKRFPSMSALKHNLQFIERFAEDEMSEPPDTPRRPNPLVKNAGKIIAALAVFVVAIGCGAGAMFLSSANISTNSSLSTSLLKLQMKFVETLDPSNDKRLLALSEQLRDAYAADGDAKQAVLYAERCIALADEQKIRGWPRINQMLRGAQVKLQFRIDSANETYNNALSSLQSLAETNRAAGRFADNVSSGTPIDATIVEIEEKLHGDRSASLALSLLDLADDYTRSGAPEKAEPVFQRALSLTEMLNKNQQMRLAQALVRQADEWAVRGKDQAESNYKNAIEIINKAGAQKSEQFAQLTRTLGLYYKNHDRITQAESTLMDALAIAHAVQGEHGELVTTLYGDLGEVYRQQKEFTKANEMFKLRDSESNQAN